VEAFEKAGIVIPFPQRDVHLKSGELPDQSGKK
jgi:small-conductance mechanosensitive channel